VLQNELIDVDTALNLTIPAAHAEITLGTIASPCRFDLHQCGAIVERNPSKPASAEPRFVYGEPTDEVTQQTARFRAVCAGCGVDLAALALQFSTRDPCITSTVVGVSHPDRVRALVAKDAVHIPDEPWAEIDRLIAAARR
jgi:aryl-alcohol dehydrogenase-like predicted oxidoreductase